MINKMPLVYTKQIRNNTILPLSQGTPEKPEVIQFVDLRIDTMPSLPV